MCANDFVNYLNTLHNYNGQNSNVFGEKNINSKYYEKIMVDIPICNFIINKLTQCEPSVIVLTGHAGDGKTSLMYQVLNTLGQSFKANEKKFNISLSNGKECLFVKDYSEFSDEEKVSVMEEIIERQKNGNYSFLVANTGPLITYLPKAFTNENEDDVKTKLIDLLDENKGDIENFYGIKMCLINIVAVNNAFFSNHFIDNITSNEFWDKCSNCSKCGYCPIIRNIRIINENKDKVKEFIYNHYIWLSEYGERLTIRSMTQQLAYMITGGLNCENVKQISDDLLLLSSNLFFGYRGVKLDKKALEINSVKDANKCGYDKKRYRADEKLFISKDYKHLFSKQLCEMIEDSENKNGNLNGWQNMIKRMYLFYNIVIDEEDKKKDLEDIFSYQFERYKDIKFNDSPTSRTDDDLIAEAFSMLNVGKINKGNDIYVTLNRESGYIQNVQLVIDSIKKRSITLKKELSNHAAYLGNHKYNDLYIYVKYNGNCKISTKINLPLFDYFNELRNGIINTNIDAQLSKGLETIKSELVSIINDGNENEDITLLIPNGDQYTEISFKIENGKIV